MLKQSYSKRTCIVIVHALLSLALAMHNDRLLTLITGIMKGTRQEHHSRSKLDVDYDCASIILFITISLLKMGGQYY